MITSGDDHRDQAPAAGQQPAPGARAGAGSAGSRASTCSTRSSAGGATTRVLAERAQLGVSSSGLSHRPPPSAASSTPGAAGTSPCPPGSERRRGLRLGQLQQVAAGHHLPQLRRQPPHPLEQLVAPHRAQRRRLRVVEGQVASGSRASSSRAARRPRLRNRFRVSFRTMVSSQPRNSPSARNRGSAAYALTNASCTTSSASAPAPHSTAIRLAIGAWRRTRWPNAVRSPARTSATSCASWCLADRGIPHPLPARGVVIHAYTADAG